MTKQEWLLNQIAQFPELSSRELVSKLNDKVLVNNPFPIGDVPDTPTIVELSNVFGTDFATRAKVQRDPIWKFILDDIAANRTEYFFSNLQNLLGNGSQDGINGIISQAHFDDILVLINRTKPDPNYQAQLWLSPAELAGFDIVLVSEVEELMNV
jgi:hypothetical protein